MAAWLAKWDTALRPIHVTGVRPWYLLCVRAEIDQRGAIWPRNTIERNEENLRQICCNRRWCKRVAVFAFMRMR